MKDEEKLKNVSILAKTSNHSNLLLATSPDTPSDHAAGAVSPSEDFYRTTSFLSIWGPCRRVGDEYLSCVVTAGMGMCKPLRRNFERCATETSGHAVEMLDQLSLQACTHLDNDKEFQSLSRTDQAIAKRNCAAEFILRSQPQGPMQ
jgi:hypothetical protein